VRSRADVDRLAALLEAGPGPASGDTATAVAESDRPLLLLAGALAQAAPPVPPMRAEARAAIRAQVVQAAREHAAEPALLTRLRDGVQRFRYSTGLATSTGVAAMALSGGGVAAAAEGAQPGQLLYPVKIGLEDVRLALTSDDVTGGLRAVRYAGDRVDEALLAVAEDDDAAAATALRGAADRLAEGTARLQAAGEVGPLLDLADAVADQRTAVAAVADRLGPDALAAAALLDDAFRTALEAVGAAVAPGVDVPQPDALPGLPLPTPDAGPAGPTAEDLPATPSTPVPDVTPPGDAAPDLPAPEVPTGHVDGPDLGLPEGPGLPDLVDPDVPTVPPAAPVPPPAAGTSVDDAVAPALDAVDGAAGDAVDQVPDAVEGAGGVVDDVLDDVLGSGGAAVEDAVGGAADGAGDALGTVGDAADGAAGAVSDLLGDD
jgi:hypothetical protein